MRNVDVAPEEDLLEPFEVKAQIKHLEGVIHLMDDEYKKSKEEIKRRIARVRRRCPHPAKHIEFYPDPSGNNDSFERCHLCGTEGRVVISKEK